MGNLTRSVMKGSYLVTQPQAKPIECGIRLVVYLRRFMMLNLTNGSQDDHENLEDVSGSQLANAMKNMDIGDNITGC